MPTVSANGLEIAYRLDGEGAETVLLINGLADEKESWGLQAGTFIEAGYRVLSLDNRGIGGTTKPAGPYTTRQMADDAKSVVDVLGIGEVHLLGYSMGGMIAQEYALAYGDTLRSLVLYATYAEPGPYCLGLFETLETLARSSGTYGQRKATMEITTAAVMKMPGVGSLTWFGDQTELGPGIRCGFAGFMTAGLEIVA